MHRSFSPFHYVKDSFFSLLEKNMASSSGCCANCRPIIPFAPPNFMQQAKSLVVKPLINQKGSHNNHNKLCVVRSSMVDSYESSSNFAQRMERAWLISQQPRPIACSSCNSKGHVECKWCSGTGFFIIGDNMLCEVPSRNTTCIICAGKGSTCCSDCKGTGHRAKWLGNPPISK